VPEVTFRAKRYTQMG